MIPEKEENGRVDVLYEILLIGELLIPSGRQSEKKSLSDILQKCHITLNSSDLMILDHSQIGNSTITIAKYTLDYMQEKGAAGKRVCVEGTVTMNTDELGTRHIRISSRPYPFRLDIDTTQSYMSLLSDNI
jgi:hypothetical protein